MYNKGSIEPLHDVEALVNTSKTMQNQSVASGKMSRDISDTRYHSLTNYVSLTVLNNVEHIQIQVELHEGLTPLNGQRMSEG